MQKKALVGNASDKEQVKKARRAENNLEEKKLDDMRWVLRDPQGRRVLWRIMSFCKSYSSAYATEANDAYYNIGQQDVGRFVMSEITKADEEKLFLMMKEHTNELGESL